MDPNKDAAALDKLLLETFEIDPTTESDPLEKWKITDKRTGRPVAAEDVAETIYGWVRQIARSRMKTDPSELAGPNDQEAVGYFENTGDLTVFRDMPGYSDFASGMIRARDLQAITAGPIDFGAEMKNLKNWSAVQGLLGDTSVGMSVKGAMSPRVGRSTGPASPYLALSRLVSAGKAAEASHRLVAVANRVDGAVAALDVKDRKTMLEAYLRTGAVPGWAVVDELTTPPPAQSAFPTETVKIDLNTPPRARWGDPRKSSGQVPL